MSPVGISLSASADRLERRCKSAGMTAAQDANAGHGMHGILVARFWTKSCMRICDLICVGGSNLIAAPVELYRRKVTGQGYRLGYGALRCVAGIYLWKLVHGPVDGVTLLGCV